MEKTQEVLVRAERERILADILPPFRTDPVLGRVYLAVDGIRGQRQIAVDLTDAGIKGASEATVSRKLETLRDLDLVELTDRTSAGKIYSRSSIDRLLKLSRQVDRILQEA